MPAKRNRFTVFSHTDRTHIETLLKTPRPECRKLAEKLMCSASSVSREVERNRVYVRHAGKTINPVEDTMDQGACERLLAWPWTCLGCHRQGFCHLPFKCTYSARDAEALAEQRKCLKTSGPRRDLSEATELAAQARELLKKGLSVYRTAYALNLAPSTLYRWIEEGFGGLRKSLLKAALRRKPQKKTKKKEWDTFGRSVGEARLYQAFCELPSAVQAGTIEMDTVLGRSSDKQCLLTLFFRQSHLQLVFLLPQKSSEAVISVFDNLERALGKEDFYRLFSHVLTDRGSEFRDIENMERSVFSGKKKRMQLYFCDPQRSNQKGGCEKNHQEIRHVLPKSSKTLPAASMDRLTTEDVSLLTSHINSAVRKTLDDKSPFQVFKFIYGDLACLLCELLNLEEIPFLEINLTPSLLKKNLF